MSSYQVQSAVAAGAQWLAIKDNIMPMLIAVSVGAIAGGLFTHQGMRKTIELAVGAAGGSAVYVAYSLTSTLLAP